MPKNIVICCDGTGNRFGRRNTNVTKLFTVLDLSDTARQVGFYDPGLGTLGAPGALTKITKGVTKVLGLAVGYGLAQNIEDAYVYLMNNYDDGDDVFLFGFSRGAYTARAVAGVLKMFGLLRRGNENLVPYIVSMLRARSPDFQIAYKFKKAFSRECKPHFVGVWDTVSSVGWIYNPVTIPYSARNPDIGIGRHAVSVDERRCFFRQNLWKPDPQQDIRQVWFSGVHSDVGGGYPEPESGLSKIAFQWMLREAVRSGLKVSQARVDRVMGKDNAEYVPPDPNGPMHKSLRGFWWLLEFWPKPYKGVFTDPAAKNPRSKWTIGRGRLRHIPEGAVIHQSVFQRSDPPKNLPKEYTVYHDAPLSTAQTAAPGS